MSESEYKLPALFEQWLDENEFTYLVSNGYYYIRTPDGKTWRMWGPELYFNIKAR